MSRFTVHKILICGSALAGIALVILGQDWRVRLLGVSCLFVGLTAALSLRSVRPQEPAKPPRDEDDAAGVGAPRR